MTALHPHAPDPHGGARSYRLSAPNTPETAKVARDMVASLLHVTGHAQLVDSARLLVSEVVANVHLHTRVPQLSLDATVQDEHVLVSVRDADPRGVPYLRRKRPEDDQGAVGGRGLPLVEHFAATWGTTWCGEPEPTGKSVWFELRDTDGWPHRGGPT